MIALWILLALILGGCGETGPFGTRPTPTPTATACVHIEDPCEGAKVYGTIPIETTDTCPGVWFESLIVDGIPSGSFTTGQIAFDTTKVGNGKHTFQVNAQSQNPGSVTLGSDSVSLNVQNNGTPAPSPTPPPVLPTATATPTATPTPGPPQARKFITAPGVYDGFGAKSQGFDVAASNVTITNWNISVQANGNNGTGVYVHGGAKNVTIKNNQIHDLCTIGVFMDDSVSYVTIDNNVITKASMAGVHIAGSYDTVSNNDISQTQQHPRLAGGIFSGCTDLSGADADGIRFQGSHHLITGNYEHDIAYGTTINPNPHIDCLQTWNPSDDITFTKNHCVWSHSEPNIGQTGMLEGINGPVSNVKITYNLLQNMLAGIQIGKNVTTVLYENNTTDHIGQEAVIFTGVSTPTSSSTIKRNIIYDSGGGGDEYTTSLVPTIADNLCRMRNGAACGTYPVNAPAISDDPRFVSNGTGTTPWNDADYHLQATTPVPSWGAFPR